MRGSYRRVEHTVRTIRYEMEAPVEAKEIGIALSWVQQEFERLNGRPVECDNDYWLEPMDEAVAFVFRVEERITDNVTPAARPRSCPTCHSPGRVTLGPFDDQRCDDQWHQQEASER